MPLLTLATEDELSEAIAQRILADFPILTLRDPPLRRDGNGYLRSRMRTFCEIARNLGPVLLITDLDTRVCPAALRKDWFGRIPQPSGLLFRVAQRTIESWLLADHEAVAPILGTSARGRLPDHPDQLADPKSYLLELAKHSPRSVRQDLRAEEGAIARQGLAYNLRLCALVRSSWDPGRAAERSPSLRRAIGRIGELAGRHPGR